MEYSESQTALSPTALCEPEPSVDNNPIADDTLIRVGDLQVDSLHRTVEVNGNTIELTSAEFEVLWLLASRAGQVVRRSQMFEELLGFSYNGGDRSIDLRVSRLRRKLGDNRSGTRRIRSVRGVGYILVGSE